MKSRCGFVHVQPKGHKTKGAAVKGTMRKIPEFSDQVVIYFSKEDKCWIAHSLRTDQIGTGEHLVNALADLICGVRGVLRAAAQDKTVSYLRAAPKKIQRLAATSKKLPGEIFEVAYKRATGQWPAEWSVPDHNDGSDTFTTEIAPDVTQAMEGAGC